jgi:hypothetical protein
MTDKKRKFEELTQTYHKRSADLAEIRYEEARVGFLLKRLKCSKLERELRRRQEQESGEYRLAFRQFHDEFPTFPILLGASTLGGVKLHLDASALLPNLFKAFMAAPFVDAYDEFYERVESLADGRAVGLVFPRKGFSQGLVIHNEGLEAVAYHGLTLLYANGSHKKNQQHQLFVRPFQTLIEAIHRDGHGWRP